MFLVLDKNQAITLVNKKGCELLGYEEEEILGQHWSSHCIPKKERKEVDSVFKRIISETER